MDKVNIIRAWKDQAYRNSLTPEERAALPENPAGVLELGTVQSSKVTGGASASGVAASIRWPRLSIFRDCSGKVDCCPRW